MAKRNPPWTRDELILALDLYFRVNPLHTSETNAEVVRVSNLLSKLGIHREVADKEHFRNPNGVYMKLCNFLRADPTYEGKGLDAGSKLDLEVWKEFATDRAHLRRTALAIATVAASGEVPRPSDVYEDEFPEGRVLTRLHKIRERNSSAVTQKKCQVLRDTGHLRCEVCEFDFFLKYGSVGEGFAECHHTTPIAELPTRNSRK